MTGRDEQALTREAEPASGLRRRRGVPAPDIIIAGLFALIGAYVCVHGLINLQMWAVYGPGPAFAPVLTGGGLVVVSLLKVLAITGESAWNEDSAWDLDTLRNPAAVLALAVLAAIAVQWVGTAVALSAFVLAVMLRIQRETWQMSISVALVVPFGIVWLFREVLSIPLPASMGY